MISLILMIFALVLFILAAIEAPSKFNLIAVGLACWVAALILGNASLR